MNEQTLKQWLAEVRGRLYLPGIDADFVESPKLKNTMACTIGVVHNHRFAFYFWSEFNKEFSGKKFSSTQNTPLFVSIDFHDDSGTESDFDKKEIEEVDVSDDITLSLYCWLRLHPLNDGHILPALYLNYFSDAYILLKRRFDNDERRHIFDKHNNMHSINYFKEPIKLIEMLRQKVDHPIYLDIDLDYFVKEDSSEIKGAGKLVPIDEIREFLNLRKPFMETLHRNLVGLTIALEPKYCGGMKNSLQVLNVLNEEFFDGSLFTERCKWKV